MRANVAFAFKAVKPILDREAPGLIHLLLSSSLRHTPFAALSRPVAGTLQKTLIVTLPGSVKAVKENMEVLLADGLISHAIELIRGGSGEATHATQSSSDVSAQGHSHHRHHAHHHVRPHHHGHDHETPRPRTLLTQDTAAPGNVFSASSSSSLMLSICSIC
jgi:gephyrin